MLAVGFGGLLLLLAFAGFDSVEKLRQIQHRNDAIRESFLARTRLLEQIRSDLYLSGTYVRDCLLEPERPKLKPIAQACCGRATGWRPRWTNTRRAERGAGGPFRDLNQALEEYWKILAPVLAWDAGQRRAAVMRSCATRSFRAGPPCCASPIRSPASTSPNSTPANTKSSTCFRSSAAARC